MRDIKILDKTTIDKIAAGEVVERPASVVKELVENAVDAMASAITVEIRDGGKELIRVTDNGSGIAAQQVRTAFLRHATSKIRGVEDLVQIASLGFRGEALSSIAAVSRVELITKTPEALTGVRYCIEGGSETVCEEIGAPSGTTFLVRDLFYNTPARARFLKSGTAEGNQAASIVEELALSHPEISFQFILNGKNRLYTSGNGNLREIIYQIYGREVSRRLIPVDQEAELMHLHGVIGSADLSRGNRAQESYFVNGRFVRSALIAKAIEDGYHGFLMQRRFPFALLYLDIDGTKVDVNVHPSKMEVRFSDQESVYHTVTLAVQNALFTQKQIPEATLDAVSLKKKTGPAVPASDERRRPEPFEGNRKNPNLAAETPAGYRTSNEPSVENKPADKPADPSGENQMKTREETLNAPFPKAKPERAAADSGGRQMELFSPEFFSKEAGKSARLIGQIFGTYWLIEYFDALYIMDQHAAHEKVLYERLMESYRNKSVDAQMLYPAPVISLTQSEMELVSGHEEIFRNMGFILEPFGGSEYRINSFPANLYRVSGGELFRDILQQLQEYGSAPPETIAEQLASMSCKAAVKGNHAMSEAEARKLVDTLMTLENPYHCPHGRPTLIRLSHRELDRKFKRIVT